MMVLFLIVRGIRSVAALVVSVLVRHGLTVMLFSRAIGKVACAHQ